MIVQMIITLLQPKTQLFYIYTFQPGKRGGGGEYEAQDGFGWTNGVFLFFLQEYGDRISSDDSVYGTATSITTNQNQFKYVLILLSNVVFARLLNI